jgi:hypothetical protein
MQEDPNKSPEEKHLPNAHRGDILAALVLIFFLASMIFCALWLEQRNRPAEVVFKDVPLEKLREVPVEKLKQVEVPAQLTDEQKNLIDLGTRMLNRPMLTNTALGLYKIPAFRIIINVPDSFKDLIHEDRIRTKLELTLRNSRIKIDETAPVILAIDAAALWQPDGTRAFHSGWALRRPRPAPTVNDLWNP